MSLRFAEPVGRVIRFWLKSKKYEKILSVVLNQITRLQWVGQK